MKLTITILALFIQSGLISQELNERSFDFWIGSWNVSWMDENGKIINGTNEITGIVNEKVIQESFVDPSTNFKGTSISVYNPITKVWHQAWADSSGAYYDFIGDLVDGNPCFKTKTIDKDGKKVIQRMVFKDITEGSFTWIWEGTRNGGESWTELWRINYTRT